MTFEDLVGFRMRLFLAAIALLTRIPVRTNSPFAAEELGKSARWFPAIGLLIGATYLAVYYGLARFFPASVVAVAIVATECFLTGALHLDGLADMADGFGGGHSREDVLRIMRDHAIGSYGAVALILLIALKLVALTVLTERHLIVPYLLISTILGRWSTVFLSTLVPYARRSADEGTRLDGNVPDNVGWLDLLVATLIVLLLVLPLGRWRGLFCWTAVLGASEIVARICRARIGGITGDTLGAATELSEVAVLLVAIALGS